MSSEELSRLRAVLAASDQETQRFLQPLLPLRGVQELLLTFVRDTSRRFEDWVWDPRVRQTLTNMRVGEPQSHAEGRQLDEWYVRAVAEQRETAALQQAMHAGVEEPTPAVFLADADAAQQDGKRKFARQDFYAASKAFQRSLAAVVKHQQSEYFGRTVPPAEWHDLDMCARYVTLCTNVAVCGLKLRDLPLIREYADKALAVDSSHCKALYALAKLRLMEHQYDEAHAIVDRALASHPANTQLVKLRKEIDATRLKEVDKRTELAAIKAEKDAAKAAAAAETPAPPSAHTEEEWELRRRKEQAARGDSVPLPSREDDSFAAARLNTFFMRIKQPLLTEITPLHNPERGEEPLFECRIANGTSGQVLASGIQAASKKLAKNEACKAAIETLWADRQAARKLVAEDVAYLERLARGSTPEEVSSTGPASTTAKETLEGKLPQFPIRVSCLERQLEPLALLNQLNQRGQLRASFEVEDVSPSKEVTQFRCTGSLNGEQLAVASAVAKKKARAEVARQMLAAAYDKKLLVVWNGPTEEDAKDAKGAKDVKDRNDGDAEQQQVARGG